MIPETKKIFSDAIFSDAAIRFGAKPKATKDLGGFESFVYEFERNGNAYILKITHSNRRTKNYLLGELEFVNFLAQHGVNTPPAIPSTNGNLVEIIPASKGYFLAYAFEKANGQLIEPSNWGNNLLFEWGKVLGQMHRLTKDYQPSLPVYKRQEWYNDDLYANRKKYISKHYTAALHTFDDLLTAIQLLPKNKDNYGLTHADLHQGNFFITNAGSIIPFDFDDCEYHYFINDIAIVLYHLAKSNKFDFFQQDIAANTHFFLQHFMEGYRTQNQLYDFSMEKLRLFLRLRHALFLTLYHQIWQGEALTLKQQNFLTKLATEVAAQFTIV